MRVQDLRRWLPALFALAAAGCASAPPAPSGPVAITPADLASLTYTGILEQPVTLTDGVYEGPPYQAGAAARPRVALVRDLVIQGDLDGDGVDDAAAILSASTGGSGSFVYLAAASGATGEPRNVGTVLLGDRVDIRTFEIDGGNIRLRILEAGPGDAACCPMQQVSRVFGVGNGALLPLARIEAGRLSPVSLAGTRWRLTHFDIGEPAPSGPEVTLEFGENGNFGGDSGCNRYMGRLETTDSGQLEAGPVAGTRKACEGPAMAVEDRYLALVGGTHQVGFYNTRLALTYHSGESAGVLLFERAVAPNE
jgi:heat shock protein HslJ